MNNIGWTEYNSKEWVRREIFNLLERCRIPEKKCYSIEQLYPEEYFKKCVYVSI